MVVENEAKNTGDTNLRGRGTSMAYQSGLPAQGMCAHPAACYVQQPTMMKPAVHPLGSLDDMRMALGAELRQLNLQRQQQDEKIAMIKEESREIERRKIIAEREVETIYQRDLAEKARITSIEEAKDAIQFLKDRGYIVRKYHVGKKATHWDIEKGSSFYKAKSPQDIVSYAEKVKLSP